MVVAICMISSYDKNCRNYMILKELRHNQLRSFFSQNPQFCPFSDDFTPILRSMALTTVGAICYPVLSVHEPAPAHRRSAWATRGLASHTGLPKMVGTISTYLVYDNLAQCCRTDPCPGQDSSSITGRLRAASAQGEWENLPSRNGNGP